MPKDMSPPKLETCSIRLTEEVQEQLEEIAKDRRKKLGSIETKSDIARLFIDIGIYNYKRTGGVEVIS